VSNRIKVADANDRSWPLAAIQKAETYVLSIAAIQRKAEVRILKLCIAANGQ
jgi:hypothetical protein